jgi:DNA-binding transcriptional LysR family regulator
MDEGNGDVWWIHDHGRQHAPDHAARTMNLRALRYLLALAECLSFSRAADRCAVTQSTLSIQVRKLEEYLGVVLFERNRAHVTLTAEGREVVRLAQQVVARTDDLIAFGRRRDRVLSRGSNA